MSLPKKNIEKMPLWAKWLFLVALLAAVLLLVSVISEEFADFYNRTVGAFFRAVLAYATCWIPFSLAEIFIYAIPLIIVGIGVFGYRRRCETWRSTFVYLGCVVSVFSLLFSSFVLGFGVGYQTSAPETRFALPETEVNAVTLQKTAAELAAQVNLLCNEVSYAESGASVMPYDTAGMSEVLIAAYQPVCERYPFIQHLEVGVKPVLASKAMSYTHITGVYSFFTGEANLNVHFPDYSMLFTAAHEMAHQRGVARENEANFVAFLVCSASADPYARYCGYLNLLEYVLNALYRADEAACLAVVDTLDARVRGEMRAFDAFFAPYRDSFASDVSGAVNDAYLKLNGNEAGEGSYGLVVELAVAYFHP